MSEWRFARGWSNSELEERLAEAAGLPVSFDASDTQMIPERGWNQDSSQAVIAREQPGPPQPDGAFVRAWRLVDSYAFSDPRIVRGHFRADSPLLGRRMLLEIQAMGLHFIGPVVVGAVRDESDDLGTVRGFRYDTLQGHLERGSRWFVIHKDHQTGRITFRISAAWQRGRLPNAWSRLGFRLFARRYQHIWHRLAHLRLRAMLGWEGREPIAIEDQLAHQGPKLPRTRIAALAGYHGRFAQPSPQQDQVVIGAGGSGQMVEAAALGAVSGARSLLGPALLARELEHQEVVATEDNRVARLLSGRLVAPVLTGLAVAEIMADKTRLVPSRTELVPFAGRVAIGSAVGAALADRDRRSAAALTGAVGAGLAALLLSRARKHASRQMGLPNAAAGLCEDALALGVGLLVVRRLRSRRSRHRD